jgi:hypothetical protein
MTPVGLPHSDISGSKRACRSPKLFAACHVLHRLSVPRHPPSTLSNLTIKCLDLMRSAVESSKSDSSCILFYNPYSIVKELPIAKIDAELRLSTALTADSRGHSAARMMDNEEGRKPIPAQPPARRLVELIGIEPTTPCLQSRCSPN